MTDLNVLWIALAASGGTLFAALLGWLDSPAEEKFSGKKFFSSVLRAVVAGGAFAIAYPLVGVMSWVVLLGAFTAGAGVDVIGNRLAGTIVGGLKS